MQNVTGTLIWYYYICKREVWLMAREINPFQEDDFLEIGRLIQDESYRREKKEISFGNIKIDLVKNEEGELIISEIKKTSKALLSAKMQLVFYLYTLKKHGISAKGELLFPKEKKKETVILTNELEEEIKTAILNIQKIMSKDLPPEPVKNNFCKNCAYFEFCWV
ncbi:MAG: CRISPR-associated protein Cas4 [Atribacterota bacterium]